METNERDLAKATMLFNMYQVSYVAKRTQFIIITNTNLTKSEQLHVKATATCIRRLNGVYFLDADGFEPIRITGDEGVKSVTWGQVNSPNGPIKFISCGMKTSRIPLSMWGQTEEMNIWYDALRYIVANLPPETPDSLRKRNLILTGIQFIPSERAKEPEIPPPPKDLNW